VHFVGFSARATGFLAELSQNNAPEWFAAHREEYEKFLLDPARAFVEELGARLREVDPKVHGVPRVHGSIKALERRRLYPGRASPPFKTSLDLIFWSGPKRAWDSSCFFVRLTPASLVLATGMIEFQKARLALYREALLDDARGAELVTIVGEVRSAGYPVLGERYKRTPPGITPEHPRAALSKHGGLFARWEGEPPRELATPAFVDFAFAHFARMSPLHAWLAALCARPVRNSTESR
jgi:uncharacterized protein (TIGR02453 family)